MSNETLQFITNLIHTGGSGAVFALVYVGYLCIKRAEEAHETLKRIEQRMVEDRESLRLSIVKTDIKIDSIHTDLQALPLQMARQRRIVE